MDQPEDRREETLVPAFVPPDATEDSGPPATPPPPEPAPERYPFWGYSDFLLFAGLAIPSLLVGLITVRTILRLLRIRTTVQAAELIPEQFLGYLLLFGALAVIFRVQYGKPFWHSLGWVPIRMPFTLVIAAGVVTAFAVAYVSTLLRTPNTPNAMTELMRERSAVILLAIFGTTVGPLCEELAFRGFLQPLLVRTFGAVAGILLAALPFGLLHFQEYGYSWRHVVLISLAGSAFGWMRHASGSTKAATLMHASYNALFFFVSFGKFAQT